MYLYSLRLQKNVFVAKIESSDFAHTAEGSTAIVWTKETGWKRICLKYFEPPRTEEKE